MIAGIESSISLDNSKFLSAMKQTKDSAASSGKSMGAYGKIVAGLEKDTASASEASSAFGAALKGGLVAGALAAAGAIAKMGYNLAKTGAQLEDAKIVFKAAGNSLDEFRSKTKGLLSDDILVKKFNFASQMGIDKESFMQLANISDAAAKKMGISQEYAFESLITGSARGSKLILDNVGILMETAKAHETYARSLGKTASKLTDAEEKQAVLNEVLRQGNKMITDVAGVGATTSDIFDQIDANTSNVATNIGAWLMSLTAVKSVLSGLADTMSVISTAFSSDETNREKAQTLHNLKSATGSYDTNSDTGEKKSGLDMYNDFVGANDQTGFYNIFTKDEQAAQDASLAMSGHINRIKDMKRAYDELNMTRVYGYDVAKKEFVDSARIEEIAIEMKHLTEDISDAQSQWRKWESVKDLGPFLEVGSVGKDYKPMFDMQVGMEDKIAELRKKNDHDHKTRMTEVANLRKQAEIDIRNLRNNIDMQNTPDEQQGGKQIQQAMDALKSSNDFKALSPTQRKDKADLTEQGLINDLAKDIVTGNESINAMEQAAEDAGKSLSDFQQGLLEASIAAEKARRGMDGNHSISSEDAASMFAQDEGKALAAMRAAQAVTAAGGPRVLERQESGEIATAGEDLGALFVEKFTEAVDINIRAKPKASGSAASFMGGLVGSTEAQRTESFSNLTQENGDFMQNLKGGGQALLGGDLAGAGQMLGTAMGGPVGAVVGGMIAEALEALGDAILGGIKMIFADTRLNEAGGTLAMGLTVPGASAVTMPMALVAAAAQLSTQSVMYNRDGSKNESKSEYIKFQEAISYALDPLVGVLGRVWIAAEPLIGLFEMMVNATLPLAEVFASFAGDPFSLIFDALQIFAAVLARVADVGLSLAGTFFWVQEAVVRPFNEELADKAKENRLSTEKAKKDMWAKMDAMWEKTPEEMAQRGRVIKGLIGEADALERTASIYNGPAGFKVASYDFGASSARGEEESMGSNLRNSIIGDINIYTDRSISDVIEDARSMSAAQAGNRLAVSPPGGWRSKLNPVPKKGR